MAVVTTGFFDGVHLGHRHLLETVVSSARERGEEAIVVTFWPHPRTVLQQDARDFRLLTSMEEKKELLLAAGVDRVEVLPFTREFAAMKAEEYLTLLRERFGATLVVMGYDNRIGSDRKTASEIGPPRPCTKTPESVHGVPISSTQIRKALEAGNIDKANGMLGYRYGLYGVVVAGNRLGRTIGFPTANMQLYEPLKLVPMNGVYAVEVEVLGRTYKGMCNIGLRPTVDGKVRTIETHILDFDEDIYGLPMRIRFLRRIRDEHKFPSLGALKQQLVLDRQACEGEDGPIPVPAPAAGCRQKEDAMLFRWMDADVDRELLFTRPDLSRNMLASLMGGVNHTRFARIIREQGGARNMKEYINRKRMNYVVELMRKYPHYSLDAIAMDCGIASSTSFNRLFRAFYGMSPSDFKKKNGLDKG